MTRFVLAVSAAVGLGATHNRGEDKDDDATKAVAALVAHLKEKGEDLRAVESDPKSYIQFRFTVGPDHDKRHVVGINHLPPLTLAEAKRKYMGYSLPYEFCGEWAVFRVGGPGGNASPEYVGAYKTLLATMREHPVPKKDK